MVLRPSSFAESLQRTTQTKQANPEPNPETVALRVIFAIIYIGQHKKYGPLGRSRRREIDI